jgi:hypothetical protein
VFLVDFCDDPDMLAVVQYHDEPFALWRQFACRGKVNHERLNTLLSNIRDWNLFLAFTIVDGCTEGKDRDKLRWFFQQVGGDVESTFTEADVL